MKSKNLKIADNSKLPIITAVCAALILFFEFCTVNIFGGKFMFTYRFPIHFEGSLIDLTESLIVASIPVLMLLFTCLYVRKKIKMLVWPLVVFVLRIIVKNAYLCVYEGHFSMKETWLDFVTYILLLVVFRLTVLGKLNTKWWLVGSCILFFVLGIIRLFITSVSYAFIVGTSVYLSTFLSYVLFFVGYGALGLALEVQE